MYLCLRCFQCREVCGLAVCNFVYAATYRCVLNCAFQLHLVELLVEVLLLLVQKLDFLVYTKPDCMSCSSFILLLLSIDLETDVFGFQLPIHAYLVKPYSHISFQ